MVVAAAAGVAVPGAIVAQPADAAAAVVAEAVGAAEEEAVGISSSSESYSGGDFPVLPAALARLDLLRELKMDNIAPVYSVLKPLQELKALELRVRGSAAGTCRGNSWGRQRRREPQGKGQCSYRSMRSFQAMHRLRHDFNQFVSICGERKKGGGVVCIDEGGGSVRGGIRVWEVEGKA